MQAFNARLQPAGGTECGFYDVGGQRDGFSPGLARLGGGSGQRQDARPSAPPAPPPPPDTPFSRVRTLKNRFLPPLAESRQLFTPNQQKAIERLERYDQDKHIGLTNAQLDPFKAMQLGDQPAERKALQRKASFLMVREILEDVSDTSKRIIDAHNASQSPRLNQRLLTAQVEALKHQVEIGLDDLCQKIARAERFCPMLTQRATFNQFLRKNDAALHAIVDCCRKAGPSRRDGLMQNLGNLGLSYLNETNRAPKGLSSNEFVDIGGITFRNGKFAVWLSNEIPGSSTFTNEYGGTFAAAFIRPEESTNSRYDPQTGLSDERYFASGFEHCQLPVKQAAVFIQKLFYEVGDLEMRIARYKGLGSSSGVEAEIAELSEEDMEHTGSVQVGDFHDELEIDPRNQRAALVDAVIETSKYAQLFSAITSRNILIDPALNDWYTSPQFPKDLEGIKHPEYRAWAFNIACVKNALLETALFSH
ncbi:MAG: hypothetical protein H7315_12780 [Herminiimonas sp.]|nr:hypothetical protein [Herminiimonas sp.]